MENLNLNFAPFYVGQKVIYLTGVHHPKDSIWVVKGIKQAKCHCANWMIDIGEEDLSNEFATHGQCETCNHISELDKNDIAMWYDSRSFAPIEERFISFADVIAKESPLIGIN